MIDLIDFRFSYFIGYDEVKARSLKATVFNLKDGKKNEKAVIGEVTILLVVVWPSGYGAVVRIMGGLLAWVRIPVVGTTNHKQTVNSTVHPSEVGKRVLRSNSEGPNSNAASPHQLYSRHTPSLR